MGNNTNVLSMKMEKLRYNHGITYNKTMQINGLLLYATIWINIKLYIEHKKPDKKYIKYDSIYMNLKYIYS